MYFDTTHSRTSGVERRRSRSCDEGEEGEKQSDEQGG